MHRLTFPCAAVVRLLACVYGSSPVDFFAEQLAGTDWTCAVPMRERQMINESIVGREITAGIFQQMDSIETQTAEACPSVCEDIAASAGPDVPLPPGFAEICAEACGRRPSTFQVCGNYSSAEAACLGVPPGRYCVSSWRRNATDPQAPPMLCVLSDWEGGTLHLDCPAGFFCRGGSTPPITCKKGLLCPAGVSFQRICPSGSICTLSSDAFPCAEDENKLFAGTRCDRGRSVVPYVCRAGEFCVNGSSQVCPRAHFCPRGSSTPHRCGSLQRCPPGTGFPSEWLADAANTFVCALIFVIVFGIGLRLGTTKPGVIGCILTVMFAAVTSFELLAYETAMFSHLIFFACNLIVVVWGAVVSPCLRRVTGKFQLAMDLAVFATVAAFFGIRDEARFDIFSSLFIASLMPAVLFCYYLVADSSVRRYWMWSQFMPLVLATIVCVVAPGLLPLVKKQDAAAVGGLILFMIVPVVWNVLVNCLTPRKNHRSHSDSTLHMSYVSHMSFQGNDGDLTFIPLAEVLSRPGGGEEPAHWQGIEMLPQDTAVEGRSSADSGKTAVGITLQNLFLSLPSGQPILNDVCLTIPAGASVAVMGPSGSGKSSITNVLSGRAGYGVVTGEVKINGSVNVALSALRGITGFVPQDDVMHRNLTVLENVTFSARLRLPQHERHGFEWAHDEAMRVIERLGLAHVKDSLIGDENKRGISGGQRKRVSIAMEFVAKPQLLFLDEPTSGLDSTTSHSVVELITQFAEEASCTSIAVIHQPRYETLCLFDQVILLATGGYLAFAGPVDRMCPYFEEQLKAKVPAMANPSDVVMDAITLHAAKRMVSQHTLTVNEDALANTAAFGDFLAKLWLASALRFGPAEDAAVAKLPVLAVHRSTWGESVVTQIRRSLIQTRRDWTQFVALTVMLAGGLVGLFVAMPTGGSTTAVLMQPTFALFLMLMLQGVSAQRIFGGAERVVGWREASSIESMVFYFAGRDIAAVLEIFLSSVLFTGVYWPLCPLHLNHAQMLWTIFAFTYAVWGLNFIFSVSLPESAAQMVSVLSSFMCLLLTGAQPSFEILRQQRIGVFLMALSPIRWAHGYLVKLHLDTPSRFENPLTRALTGELAHDFGLPMQWISSNSTLFPDGWTCSSNPPWMYTGLRWRGCRNGTSAGCTPGDANHHPGLEDLPAMSFVCSTRQLFLMGVYFRFIALVFLLLTAKAQATGGSSAVEVPGSRRSSGDNLGRLLQRMFYAFIVALTWLEVNLLLSTF